MTRRRRTRLQQLIVEHLAKRKLNLALVALCMAGALLMELLAPWPLKLIFDHVLMGKPLSSAWSYLAPVFGLGPLPAIAVLSASVFVMVVVGGACSYGQVYVATKSGYQFSADLKIELFSHVQRLSQAFHSQARAGELVMKMASDTVALRDLLTDWGARTVYQAAMIIGMLVVMLGVNWRLALVVLGSLPVLYIVLARINRKVRASVQQQRKQEGRIASRMNEVLGSIAMVQAFARQEFEEARFRQETEHNLTEGIGLARTSAAITRMIEVVCALSTAITLLVGSWQAFKGEMSPGDLLIFVSYLRAIYKPIRDLGRASVRVTRAAVCADRIEEVLSIQAESPDPPSAIAVSALNGDIEFKDVYFAYAGRRQVLEKVSFHIQAGHKVALLGASGAGKSSLIGLILRLYEPQSGSILIDGVDVKGYRRDSLRRNIGVVLQDSLLFAATVRDNIAYGMPEATFAEIEAAARHAHADEFIRSLPDGYETWLGERGSTLSGGQRQRLCLARALVKQPSILILDEPTSAVDPTSASLIHDSIDRVQKGKTVLIISHQASPEGDFDRILTLRDRGISVTGADAVGVCSEGFER